MMMQHKDKNIRLKHVKYIRNSTQTKLNFSGTHKPMLTSHNTNNNNNINEKKMFSPKSKHFNSSSNITGNTNMNNIFRNYSPSQGITSLYSLNKQTNIFKHNTNVNNNNNSNSNNMCYQVTKTTPNSPNNATSKTKAITNIHKYNRNNHNHPSNSNNNNNNNLTNPTLTHYIKTKKPSLMITTNPSSALRSSTSSFSQGNIITSVCNTNTTTKRKYTSKKPRNKINNINTYFHISSHKSHDFLSAQLSPSSSIRKFHNDNTANMAALTTNINQLSTKENSITLNNKVRTTIKTSLYTDYCTNTIKDIQDIDTPEDLHFFYVSVIQNGKLVEFKFEVESTNNNNNN